MKVKLYLHCNASTTISANTSMLLVNMEAAIVAEQLVQNGTKLCKLPSSICIDSSKPAVPFRTRSHAGRDV